MPTQAKNRNVGFKGRSFDFARSACFAQDDIQQMKASVPVKPTAAFRLN